MDKSLFFELLIISTVVLWIIFQLGKYYGRYKGDKATLEKLEQLLHNLTPDEKTYLSSYVINDEKTQHFKIKDSVSEVLEKKIIIYKPNSAEDLVLGHTYNIQPWAKKYLVKNPHLLESTTQIQRESSDREN